MKLSNYPAGVTSVHLPGFLDEDRPDEPCQYCHKFGNESECETSYEYGKCVCCGIEICEAVEMNDLDGDKLCRRCGTPDLQKHQEVL